MRSSVPIERAQPLLGTRVAIRVEGLGAAAAHRAIDEAFEEVAIIHRLMSFHESRSDVSLMNREACHGAVKIHRHTFDVLAKAQEFAEASHGCFDITVAPKLVACGILPAPDAAPADPNAHWGDIELGPDCWVRFNRALWIDLGGIAKGYAVDRALETVRAHGASQMTVNAGGDLRICGPAIERVLLEPEHLDDENVPALDIENAAVASSSGHLERRVYEGVLHGPHFDGVERRPIPTDRFVSVVAETCMIADALTKIVLARMEDSAVLLQQYGAFAHVHDPGSGWRHLGVS
jgi:thiamine biosynthesis lipoprotein